MNAIGGFSARLNGVRQGHPAKMSSRQKLTCGLSGTHVENQSRTGAASMSDDLSAILLRDCGLKVRLSDFSDIVPSTKKPRTMPGLQFAGDIENSRDQ
jgi:hypothetical protein